MAKPQQQQPAEPDHYYTFVKVPPPVDGRTGLPLKVTKWDKYGEPLASYFMVFNYRVAANACECPAYRACKHVKAVYELWQQQQLQSIEHLRWDEVNGWTKQKDAFSDLFA